jgi:hypothetical protein
MRGLSLPRLVFILLCSSVLLGCDVTGEPELTAPVPTTEDLQLASAHNENPFLGSWRATSVIFGEVELLPGPHFRFIQTFWSDGSASTSVSGDTDHLICPSPNESCSWSGSFYTYTATTLTTLEPNHPDPGEQGEDTSLYAFCANKLFFMDTLDDGEGGFRMTFERTRRNCYVKDCG